MTTDNPISWREAFAVYLHRRVLAMLFLGFSAGLPFLLVFSTLSAWLRDLGVTRTAIGFFAWIGITYSIKVVWAPVVDRVPIPFLTRALGKRRSWMLTAQLGIAAGLLGMALTDPTTDLVQVAVFALLVAFSSATQDISIDAYRIEAVVKERQAAMAATYILGYRLALLVAGAGALYIATYASWPNAYFSMAALTLIGMVTALAVSEPVHHKDSQNVMFEQRVISFMSRSASLPDWLRGAIAWVIGAVICPFADFFTRNGWWAVVILVFIGVFRLSDLVMGIMANPFYLDLGFTKTEIANIAKIFGFVMSVAGSFLGGAMVIRYGIMRPLLLGAVMVAATNLLFAFLAMIGPDKFWLAAVISADNISAGLSNAVFIAYLSSLTNQAYTATQYALFSSFMTLPGKVISGFSGVIVDASGYVSFFVYAAAVGIPAILLVIVLMRCWNIDNNRSSTEPTP
jgi:PAT family beta-lactamase induction signal transducer AmpG